MDVAVSFLGDEKTRMRLRREEVKGMMGGFPLRVEGWKGALRARGPRSIWPAVQ